MNVAGMCWARITGTGTDLPRPWTRLNKRLRPAGRAADGEQARRAGAGARAVAAAGSCAGCGAAADAIARRRSRASPFTFSVSSRRNVSSPNTSVALGFGT